MCVYTFIRYMPDKSSVVHTLTFHLIISGVYSKYILGRDTHTEQQIRVWIRNHPQSIRQ